ncbi:MCE family protein [Nocardioides sp. zg-579]|uniref:MCE family protein n=1 Tax=Nocardioides marmotae TaxID=2663857 RepID=A0A6I3J2Q4_9ACTN|nr:MCE family protein [Nocardioides marmotae]MCR6031147.1 MCE family protein [Gordonia jinghuaiqii]MTB94786.1 MCE family protein [Nocardioides marmotae]QKE01221.1 MCE family protein [Nocardioides marmotae]
MTRPRPRSRPRQRRALVGLASLAAAVPLLAACDFDGAYDLPLPGSPVSGEETFTVTAEFHDVLNVVPRSPVMVSDVVVGEVDEVDRDGWNAVVRLKIRSDIELPDNAVAEIRQTSLLGEKYVALEEPTGRARGRLEDGDRLELADTGRNPEVEEVLGALSFLLSGGGVGQIKQISDEVNDMLSGRTDDVRSLFGQLEELVGGLDEQKDDIVSAMESLNRLAATLNRESRTITDAIEATGPALEVLNQQHEQLVAMLGQLDELGEVGTRVINGTKENLLADLDHLRPILKRLNETGDSLPRGLSLLISFPFPEQASEIVKGDYANAKFALDVSLEGLTQLIEQPGDGPSIPLPDIPGLPDLPDIPLPDIPGLPTLPGLGRTATDGYTHDASVGTGGGLLAGGLG